MLSTAKLMTSKDTMELRQELSGADGLTPRQRLTNCQYSKLVDMVDGLAKHREEMTNIEKNFLQILHEYKNDPDELMRRTKMPMGDVQVCLENISAATIRAKK